MAKADIIQTRNYNSDIAGSELSLKIASYPVTAQYLANRLNRQGSTICELCCGVGVSLIEFAKTFEKVIGVDNDQSIIDDCRTNLNHASVTNYELLVGDVSARDVLAQIQADIVLYDIPYWSNHKGKVDAAKQNPKLGQLVADIRELITNDIVIYTPHHMSYEEVKQQIGECEYLEVWLDGKHDRNFVFLGSLVETAGKTKIDLYN